jgi:class 3 adenylate cyclase/predicted ATPase
MALLSAYLPRDRYRTLAAGGDDLPDRTQGAALFADISGFTPLAEELTASLGPLRGPEELTRHLNLVYEAVIAEVDRCQGSVLAFAGDAMTCWFDGDDGHQATASALAMQAVMGQFASVALPSGKNAELTIKIGIAVGPARRFRVGDPAIQVIDVLAGATLARMAAAQQIAKKREVVVDGACARRLGEVAAIAEWRTKNEDPERFAVVTRLAQPVEPTPWPAERSTTVPSSQLREWLLPPVYDRLTAQEGEFLTEMRPAVALFIRFGGIDYDGDDAAGAKLDAYVRWVQQALAAYDGFLIEITIGDKGSYLYSTFGAPIVHENDVGRALTVALELRAPPPELHFIRPVQIGISKGTMRTGAYGGTTRRTYGVQGDDVNLAARLMQHAAPGQVLASGRVRKSAGEAFRWETLPPIAVKGKAEPVPAYALLDKARQQPVRLHEPNYALPMVGRTAELGCIRARLALARSGRGQIVGITGEAGVGKSRLVAEAIRLANEQGMIGYGGQSHSYGTNTSYLSWWSIWQAFFEVDPEGATEEQIQHLAARLGRINPDLVMRLPLLGAVVRLAIPDNEVTRAFDAKLRKSSLEALLTDCLRAAAGEGPRFLVLEDCHWLDPLSRDLLDVIGRALSDLPVLLLLAYRPPEAAPRQADRLASLPYFTEIALTAFTPDEAERLIGLKVERLFGEGAHAPSGLVQRFITRAEGNPFYIEELLNYLQDRGIGLEDTPALEHLELPTSLHSLILSRIDQLTEHQKITLKVASVIGRIFRAAMLWGSYPELGQPPEVKADLEVLHRLDVTALDVPEPELIYLFKHIVTQEVAYESLPYATRAMLHERIGGFVERTYADQLEQHLDLLAYHFDRSDHAAKKREYLWKAGLAAQGRYANSSALDYYRRAEPLLSGTARVDAMLRVGQVLELLGRWKEAHEVYAQALALAEQADEGLSRARSQAAIGELLRKEAHYAEAASWLVRARDAFAQLGDEAGLAQALHCAGTLAAQQGDHVKARAIYLESLAIRRKLNDRARISSLLSNLCILAHQFTGESAEAQALGEEALAIRRELGDRWAIANSLNNLGVMCQDQGDLPRARALMEESVALNRQVGDRWAIANSLSSLAAVTLDQGDFGATRRLLEESLAINRELDEPRAIAYVLESFGMLAARQGKPDRAFRLMGAASALRQTIGAPLSPAELAQQRQLVESACGTVSGPTRSAWETEGTAMTLAAAVDYAVRAQ